jgi:hypothetical protein
MKPNQDGSSYGACPLYSYKDFVEYKDCWIKKKRYYKNTALSNESIYILNPYLKTDRIHVENGQLVKINNTGWLEGTIGCLGNKIFNPSICLNESGMLTIEEKFMSGRGINLTPPPPEILDSEDIKNIKQTVLEILKKIGIKTYARIDFFYNCVKKQFILIEINTLPGLTPSTVLFHQSIQEQISPLELMENIIELSLHQ